MGKALFTKNVTIAFARAFANSGLMSTASVLVLAPFIICVTAAAVEAQQMAALEKAASSRIRIALNVIGSIERNIPPIQRRPLSMISLMSRE
jgi:hypothetical protein